MSKFNFIEIIFHLAQDPFMQVQQLLCIQTNNNSKPFFHCSYWIIVGYKIYYF